MTAPTPPAAVPDPAAPEAATRPVGPEHPAHPAYPSYPQYPSYPPRRRAPVFTMGDLLGAVSVLSLVSLLGLPLAWVWSRLAPPQRSLVQEGGALAALPPESQHRFDDLAIFLLLGLAAGVLCGVGVWMLRQRRGPLALLGLTAGSLVAAWLAMRTGVSFADGRFAEAVRVAAPGSVVAVAPRLESGWVVVAQPLAAALTYGVAAAVNGLDDLGRRLS
ncbi:MAG TPA: DUF2567 domain-containing protein [Pseudonocardiaceae bacterium]